MAFQTTAIKRRVHVVRNEKVRASNRDRYSNVVDPGVDTNQPKPIATSFSYDHNHYCRRKRYSVDKLGPKNYRNVDVKLDRVRKPVPFQSVKKKNICIYKISVT